MVDQPACVCRSRCGRFCESGISYLMAFHKEAHMRWVYGLLLVLLLSSGCGDDNKVISPSEKIQIWPLKVGNQWTYEETVLDSAGNVVNADTSVWEVVQDTLILGETWYILTIDGVVDSEFSPVANRGDGLWQGGPSGALVFKYPAAVDDTCMLGTDTAIVESITDTITVPGGTFVCYNYKWVGNSYNGERPYQFHYMSPGIGFIMAEEYHKTPEGYIYPNVRSVLLSKLIL